VVATVVCAVAASGATAKASVVTSIRRKGFAVIATT
jgi:hypothetical protein